MARAAFIGLAAAALASSASASQLTASVSVSGASNASQSAQGATGPVSAAGDSGNVLVSAIADYGVLKAAFTGGASNGAGQGTLFQNVATRAKFEDILDFTAQSLDITPIALDWVYVTAKFSVDAAFVNAATGGAYSTLRPSVQFSVLTANQSEGASVKLDQTTTISSFGSFTTVSRQNSTVGGGISMPTTLPQLAGDYTWTFAARTGTAYTLTGALECTTFQYIPASSSIGQACNLGQSVYWQGIASVTDLAGHAVNWAVGSQSGFAYANSYANQPGPSVVPEPGIWALMVLGFAATAGAVRRRRSGTVRTA